MNQEIVLFNFHKHPALKLYTAWHFQMDDGSKEYSLLQNDRIKRSLIRHINKFIRNLDIPSFCNFTKFNYYDVLL